MVIVVTIQNDIWSQQSKLMSIHFIYQTQKFISPAIVNLLIDDDWHYFQWFYSMWPCKSWVFFGGHSSSISVTAAKSRRIVVFYPGHIIINSLVHILSTNWSTTNLILRTICYLFTSWIIIKIKKSNLTSWQKTSTFSSAWQDIEHKW